MRIALIGDFDTYICRGLERPRKFWPCCLPPGTNLLRGFRELGVKDIYIVVTTKEVQQPSVEEGPLGTVQRFPQPALSGTGTFHLW
jgi:hypothetical protein